MKRLSIFFAALLVSVSSLFAATATVTFTAGTDKSSSLSLTKGGITLEITTGTLSRDDNYRVYANNSLTITSTVGNMTSVAFTCVNKKDNGAGQLSGTGYTSSSNTAGTWSGDATTFTLKATKQAQITKIVVTYTAEEGVPDAPTFETTETDFTGSTEVKLKAEEGLDIYYTLDGTEPTATTGTKYNAEQPITISKTTTVKAIAYNTTTKTSSAVAEKTYTRYELITECGDLIYAVNNDFVKLDKVTVIYVNGANMYICDNTGYGLLYKDSYGLKAGQVVEGIEGRVSIYNALPEIIPSVEVSALTITEGTVPAPVVIAAVPTAEDLNKYVRIEGVKTTAATWSSEDTQASDRTLVAKLGEKNLTLYNTFKIDKTFAAGNYNIVGFVTCYNTTIQIAVVSATAVYTVEAVANEATYGTVDGVGNYEEGESVTLKAEPATGYKFVNWTDLNDKVVSTDAEYTFKVTEEVALIANFVKDSATAIDAAESAKTATKTLENGVLVITRDGIRYNAQGVVME